MLKIAMFVLMVCAAPSFASTQARSMEPPFAAQLEQARSTLRVDGRGLHGPGAAVIAKAVAQARYVLIGEDHLSREIPQFTAGICRMMAPGGLDAFAVEIGPQAANIVNDSLRRPDRARRIASFLQTHPDSIAFQNGQDESDMAAECARLAGPQLRLWGLDQEFFGASGYLLEQMLAAHPGPTARAAIKSLIAADRTATKTALTSGSPTDLLVFTITDRTMADARAAIKRDGGGPAKRLFDTLAETRAIYLAQSTDPFASNGRRARLLKRTLMQYLDGSPKTARVLFKFGDMHSAKGFNDLEQRDLGNFVVEYAEGAGQSSLHLAVYGAKGVHAFYAGVGRQVSHKPFLLTDDPDYVWIKDALTMRDAAGADKEWMVIDLRTLRGRKPSVMSGQWRRAVERYDLLVVAPELTPSTMMGTTTE